MVRNAIGDLGLTDPFTEFIQDQGQDFPNDTGDENAERQRAVAEVRRLLGPLVGPLLREAGGHLDLSKIPARNFFQFREYLQTQVSVDGIAFNSVLMDSYHKVLGKKEYTPLLRALYEESKGLTTPLPQTSPPEGGEGRGTFEDLLKQFTADIIDVSAERFVGNNLYTQVGRDHLRSVLGDPTHFTKDIRADVAKAIAHLGEQEDLSFINTYGLKDQISVYNYFNVSVTEEEMTKATQFAENLLEDADWQNNRMAEILRKYEEDPEELAILPSTTSGIKARITRDELRKMIRLYKENKDESDLLSQMRAKLANFWLLNVVSDHWVDAYASGETRAFLTNQTETLLTRSLSVQSDADFIEFNKRVLQFLEDPTNENDDAAWNWIKHKTIGRGLEEVYGDMPSTFKAPYEELRKFSEGIHYALEMGETISMGVGEVAVQEATLQQAAVQMIQGLQNTKRELWYGYKQHKFISRAASNFIHDKTHGHFGDIGDIQRANAEIDKMITRLQKATTAGEINGELKNLYESMEEGGVLHQAFEASEMDGIEQVIGLVQTIAIIIGTVVVTEGMGTVGAVANAVRTAGTLKNLGGTLQTIRTVQITQAAAKAAQISTLVGRARYGMKMGAWISLAENSLAVTSGELRPAGADNLLAWGKDSLATGIAMGLFTPLAARAGMGIEQNILKRLTERYFTRSLQGLSRFGGDTALEGMEELFDAYIRLKMDGHAGAISFDQFREITLVSASGGGVKMGSVASAFRGNGPHKTSQSSNFNGSIPAGGISPSGYANFLRESLELARTGETSLTPENQIQYERTLQRAQAERWDPERTVGSLLQIFYQNLKDQMGELVWEESYDFRKAIEEAQAAGQEISPGLLRWMEAQDGELIFPELQISFQKFSGMIEDQGQTAQDFKVFLTPFMGLEEFGVLPDGFVMSDREHSVAIRMIPPELIYQLPRSIYGEDAVEIVPTTRLSTFEEVVRMFRRQQRPMVISPQRQNGIHENNQVHPSNAALHDVFHLFQLGQVPLEVRKNLGIILDAFLEIRGSISHSEADQEWMESLIEGKDLNGPYDYSHLFRRLPTESKKVENLLSFHEKLSERLEGHPRAKEILAQLEAQFPHVFSGPEGGLSEDILLGRTRGMDPKDAAQLNADLERLWGALPIENRVPLEIEWIRLHRIETAYPRIRSYLLSPYPADRVHALRALIDLKPDEMKFPELVDLLAPFVYRMFELAPPEVEEVCLILKAMAELGIPRQNLMGRGHQYLKNLQNHSRLEVRAAADTALTVLNRQPPASVLRRLARSRQPEDRHQLLFLLDSLGKEIKRQGEGDRYRVILQEGIRDEDPSLRSLAVRATGQVREREDAAGDLYQALQEESDWTVQKNILLTLGRLHPERSEIGQEAAKFLSHEDPGIALAAAHLMVVMGRVEEALPVFQRLLGSHDNTLRMATLDSLQSLLEEGNPLAQTILLTLQSDLASSLTYLLRDSKPGIRWRAARLRNFLEPDWNPGRSQMSERGETQIESGTSSSREIIQTQAAQTFLKNSLREMGKGVSSLRPKNHARYQETIRRAHAGEISALAMAQEILEVFYEDLLEGLGEEFYLQTYHFRDALLETQRKGNRAPGELHRWVAQFSEEDLIFPQLQLSSMEYQRLSQEKSQTYHDFYFLETFFSFLENAGVLPPGFSTPAQNGTMILRMIPPKLLAEMAVGLFGHQAVEYVPTSQMSNRQEMLEMTRKHQRPLIMSPHRQVDIHDSPNVHPANAAYHDIYHAIRLSWMPEAMRADMKTLLDIYLETGGTLEDKSEGVDIAESILDGEIITAPYDYRPVFARLKMLREKFVTEERVLYFRGLLEDRFSGHPRKETILEQFEEFFPTSSRRTREKGGDKGSGGRGLRQGLTVLIAGAGVALSQGAVPDVAHGLVGIAADSGASVLGWGLSLLGLGILGMVRGRGGDGKGRGSGEEGAVQYLLQGREYDFIKIRCRRAGLQPPRFIDRENIQQVIEVLSRAYPIRDSQEFTTLPSELVTLIRSLSRHFPEEMEKIMEEIESKRNVQSNPATGFFEQDGEYYYRVPPGEKAFGLGREDFESKEGGPSLSREVLDSIAPHHAGVARYPFRGFYYIFLKDPNLYLSVNGVQMDDEELKPLESGDRISLGGLEFTFLEPDPKKGGTHGGGAALGLLATLGTSLYQWINPDTVHAMAGAWNSAGGSLVSAAVSILGMGTAGMIFHRMGRGSSSDPQGPNPKRKERATHFAKQFSMTLQRTRWSPEEQRLFLKDLEERILGGDFSNTLHFSEGQLGRFGVAIDTMESVGMSYESQSQMLFYILENLELKFGGAWLKMDRDRSYDLFVDFSASVVGLRRLGLSGEEITSMLDLFLKDNKEFDTLVHWIPAYFRWADSMGLSADRQFQLMAHVYNQNRKKSGEVFAALADLHFINNIGWNARQIYDFCRKILVEQVKLPRRGELNFKPLFRYTRRMSRWGWGFKEQFSILFKLMENAEGNLENALRHLRDMPREKMHLQFLLNIHPLQRFVYLGWSPEQIEDLYRILMKNGQLSGLWEEVDFYDLLEDRKQWSPDRFIAQGSLDASWKKDEYYSSDLEDLSLAASQMSFANWPVERQHRLLMQLAVENVEGQATQLEYLRVVRHVQEMTDQGLSPEFQYQVLNSDVQSSRR